MAERKNPRPDRTEFDRPVGRRKQCRKLVGMKRQNKPDYCGMPLNTKGECPQHGRDTQ